MVLRRCLSSKLWGDDHTRWLLCCSCVAAVVLSPSFSFDKFYNDWKQYEPPINKDWTMKKKRSTKCSCVANLQFLASAAVNLDGRSVRSRLGIRLRPGRPGTGHDVAVPRQLSPVFVRITSTTRLTPGLTSFFSSFCILFIVFFSWQHKFVFEH